MNTNNKRKAILVVGSVLLGLAVAVAFVHTVQLVRAEALGDKGGVGADAVLLDPVSVAGVEVIEQQVSCGYAVIEMLSSWAGAPISEASLMEQNGSVVTATGQSFRDELARRLPDFKVDMRAYLPPEELLRALHKSLGQGRPVAIEWAALREGQGAAEWTLHYSVVVGLDVARDEVTVANPYGYLEKISVEDFLARTSFEAYEGMPLWMHLAFDFGVFERNAVFLLTPA